jgi:ATP-binding protein involved in chromosome partitioning
MKMDCSQPRDDRAQAIDERMALVKHKIVVLSGKGGVGKSTVAVSLATSLAFQGKRVGLLDIDLHGPTVPQLLGLGGQRPVTDGQMLLPVEVGANLKVMSIGLLLGEEDGAVVWRGPMKAVAIEQFLGEVEWGELDYLIVDSPPGTGDEPLAVCQAIGKMDGAIVVTTPQQTALSNVRRSIKFCAMLDLKVLGVIENMAGFVCPHCGETTNVFSKGGGAAMARKAGVPLLASVPLDPAIVEAGDEGRSFSYHRFDSPAARELAKALAPILALDDENGWNPTLPDGLETPAPNSPARESPADPLANESPASPAAATGGDGDTVTRFAIPSTDGLLCPHFGHCNEFALVDVDVASKSIVGKTMVLAPEHEPGLLPSWLAQRGARVIIAGGMGSHAQQLFMDQGVTVITGAPTVDPETAVQQYLAGSLVTGENVCDH